MFYLMCTQSVQIQIGLSKASFVEAEESDQPLGNWYVNLIPVGRKYAYLFMSDRTLFSFAVPERKPLTPATLVGTFAIGLSEALQIIGISEAAADLVIDGYMQGRLAKSKSRSDLGSLKDLALIFEHWAMSDGGLQRCNITRIVKKLNEIPQRRLKWHNASEATKAALTPAT